MSMQQVPDATLPGWEGPFYPTSTAQLVEAMDARPEAERNRTALERVARRIDGFLSCTRLTSADGYGWFWTLEFQVKGSSRVLVALPWSQDWDQRDGTQLDRSPAVYTRRATSDQVASVLTSLIRVMPAAS